MATGDIGIVVNLDASRALRGLDEILNRIDRINRAVGRVNGFRRVTGDVNQLNDRIRTTTRSTDGLIASFRTLRSLGSTFVAVFGLNAFTRQINNVQTATNRVNVAFQNLGQSAGIVRELRDIVAQTGIGTANLGNLSNVVANVRFAGGTQQTGVNAARRIAGISESLSLSTEQTTNLTNLFDQLIGGRSFGLDERERLIRLGISGEVQGRAFGFGQRDAEGNIVGAEEELGIALRGGRFGGRPVTESLLNENSIQTGAEVSTIARQINELGSAFAELASTLERTGVGSAIRGIVAVFTLAFNGLSQIIDTIAIGVEQRILNFDERVRSIFGVSADSPIGGDARTFLQNDINTRRTNIESTTASSANIISRLLGLENNAPDPFRVNLGQEAVASDRTAFQQFLAPRQGEGTSQLARAPNTFDALNTAIQGVSTSAADAILALTGLTNSNRTFAESLQEVFTSLLRQLAAGAIQSGITDLVDSILPVENRSTTTFRTQRLPNQR